MTLTATVRDAETPVAQLKYEWKADAGTFTGEGASVKWRAPKGATTPGRLRHPADRDRNVRDGERRRRIAAEHRQRHEPGHQAARLAEGARRHGPAIPRRLRQLLGLALHVRARVQRRLPWQGRREEPISSSTGSTFSSRARRCGCRTARVASSGLSADTTVACTFTSRIIKCEPGSAGCVGGERGNRRRRLHADQRVRAAAMVVVHQHVPEWRAAAAGVPVLLFFQAELTLL